MQYLHLTTHTPTAHSPYAVIICSPIRSLSCMLAALHSSGSHAGAGPTCPVFYCIASCVCFLSMILFPAFL